MYSCIRNCIRCDYLRITGLCYDGTIGTYKYKHRLETLRGLWRLTVRSTGINNGLEILGNQIIPGDSYIINDWVSEHR